MRDMRAGTTIIDLVVGVTLIGIFSAIAFTRGAAYMDSIRVRGASADVAAMFSAGRRLAITRARRTTVDVDTTRRTMSVRIGTDTLRRRDIGLIHDVRITASRSGIAYAATGMGYGAANITVVVRRGAAVDSIFVSRLGRVRRLNQ